MTDEQHAALLWAEKAIKGKRMGASSNKLKLLLELVNELHTENELLRNMQNEV